MKIRVYYEDTDLGGVVYHANYLKFCERARSEAFFQKDKSPVVPEGHFVAQKITMNFIVPAKLGDMLEVRTTLLDLKGASFTLLQQIYKEEKEIFKCGVKLVFIDKERPVKIPDYLKKDLQTIFREYP